MVDAFSRASHFIWRDRDQDSDVHVRKLAALALGDLGPLATQAVPALIEALQDKHPAVRRRVAVALGEIGDVAVVAVLKKALQDSHESICRAAALALQELALTATRQEA